MRPCWHTSQVYDSLTSTPSPLELPTHRERPACSPNELWLHGRRNGAERCGRLFGLAVTSCYGPGPDSGDLRWRLTIRGCQPTTSHARVEFAGLSPSWVPTFPRWSQADVDALATWVALKALVGEDGSACCASARYCHGPTRRGRVDHDPRRVTEHPNDASPTTNLPRHGSFAVVEPSGSVR